jgi:acyl-CoA synthetase (NDP forming)
LAIAVLQDPEVTLLLLYIESIRNADMLAEAAAVARRRGVPIVAVKTGRTVRGQQAARSHTAALANDDRTVDAFFARHGIWRVDDIHQLVSASELYLKGWRPQQRKLVVVSNSGASCVMAADSAHALGIELATLPEATVKTLAALLPPFATAVNPIDITAALLSDSGLFGRILSVLAEDSDADLYLIAIPVAGVGYDVPMFARDAADFMSRTGKAVVVAAPQESVANQFRAAGVPSFANQTEAMTALAQIAGHAELMRPGHAAHREKTAIAVPRGEGQFLDEAESLAWLHAHGMPTVAHRRCRSVQDAQDAHREFGGPVAIKGCAKAVPHKSEHGLVSLNVSSADDIAAAFARLKSTLDALGVEGDILVAPMIAGRIEVLLGAKIDPMFGPVVIVGDGGKYVEVYGDVQLLIPPVTFDDVRAAVRRLRIAPFFEGVRGEPELDLEALCVAAVRLSEIMASSRDQIASIDLNPVMVGVRGEGVTIVDAVIERNLRPLVVR